ncbi:MAG: methionyl-tRNA formyltransferase [Actinomycetota bacterium]|nr:methionyl-tRNA formyltransferase [Actinomycetota bacterium]
MLEALVGAGHDLRLVLTMPDRRRGRGGALVPTAVKARALALGLPVSERVADATACGAELGVVVAFGRLIKPEVLAKLSMVNLHFSLLPRWRGAAPVERAILAGDEETGVCVMALEEGLDTGPVYASAPVRIGEEETAAELRARLGDLGTGLLLECLAGGLDRLGSPRPQVGEATYADKIRPEELILDWRRPAGELARVVRVGRASTTFRGRRLLVHRARPLPAPSGSEAGVPGTARGDAVWTGEGLLALIEVQGEGRARQPFASWAAGARVAPGERFGD